MPIFVHSNFDGAANERPQFTPPGPVAPAPAVRQKARNAVDSLVNYIAIVAIGQKQRARKRLEAAHRSAPQEQHLVAARRPTSNKKPTKADDERTHAPITTVS